MPPGKSLPSENPAAPPPGYCLGGEHSFAFLHGAFQLLLGRAGARAPTGERAFGRCAGPMPQANQTIQMRT